MTDVTGPKMTRRRGITSAAQERLGEREHWISSHVKPLLIAWSIVGDGSSGSPSVHIRSFQLSQRRRSASCSLSLGPDLVRLRGEDVGHRARLPELLVQGFTVASRERRRVVLRCHPDIRFEGYPATRRRLLERRPAQRPLPDDALKIVMRSADKEDKAAA